MRVQSILDVFGKGVPEGGDSKGEGSIAQVWCLVLHGTDETGTGSIIQENFELEPLWNRKLVNHLKDCGDMIAGTRVSKQVSRRVLDVLYGCMGNDITIKRITVFSWNYLFTLH